MKKFALLTSSYPLALDKSEANLQTESARGIYFCIDGPISAKGPFSLEDTDQKITGTSIGSNLVHRGL